MWGGEVEGCGSGVGVETITSGLEKRLDTSCGCECGREVERGCVRGWGMGERLSEGV